MTPQRFRKSVLSLHPHRRLFFLSALVESNKGATTGGQRYCIVFSGSTLTLSVNYEPVKNKGFTASLKENICFPKPKASSSTDRCRRGADKDPLMLHKLLSLFTCSSVVVSLRRGQQLRSLQLSRCTMAWWGWGWEWGLQLPLTLHSTSA